MSDAKHTPGPWAWFENNGRPYLATPDRGRLFIMDFIRKGMQSATARFAHWRGIKDGEPRERFGGIMEEGIFLSDGTLHPDARLIAAAPELLSALELYGLSYSDADLNQLAECQTGRGEIDPATAKREIIRRNAIAKAKGQP